MERTRAYLNEDGNPRQLVTILNGRIGGRGTTEIRDGYGNVRDVKSNLLERIPSNDPAAKLKFEAPSD